MGLHITARFAWHDSWDGKVCKSPRKNFYCSGNYSLLSSRINRRKKVALEENYSGKYIDEISEDYIPPCYWTINALGSNKYKIKHIHPFSDFDKTAESDIEPLSDELHPYSIFTWNFKLAFNRRSTDCRYPCDLEDRVEVYTSYIIPKDSVVVFYSNYSNPVNGDNRRYLILGVAIVKEVKGPQRFKFNENYFNKLNKQYCNCFPTINWSFQVILDPESIVMLPYSIYIDKMSEEKDDTKYLQLEKNLEEITVEVDEKSIEPSFKYVSMHISTDDVLYLAYKIKEALEKMKDHSIVELKKIEMYLERIEKIIRHLWGVRGKYPSLKRVMLALGNIDGVISVIKEKGDRYEKLKFNYKEYKKYEDGIDNILKKYKIDIERLLENHDKYKRSLLEKMKKEREHPYAVYMIKKLFDKLSKENYGELIKLLCSLDLKFIQIYRILKMLKDERMNSSEIVNNPYSLIYKYIPDYRTSDEWFYEFIDSDIPLYVFDIRYIPDLTFMDAHGIYREKDPNSPERLVAAMYSTLYSKAILDGVTALNESDLLETMKKTDILVSYYDKEPYISKEDTDDIIAYHKKLLSDVIKYIDDDYGRIFQLKSIRLIEKSIEDTIKQVLTEKHKLSKDKLKSIEEVLRIEQKNLSSRDLIERQKKDYLGNRRKIYMEALENGLMVITGEAGTGKTELVTNLAYIFLKHGVKPVFLFTPTGKASLVIENRLKSRDLDKLDNFDEHDYFASTIHRFLYSYYFERYVRELTPYNERKTYRNITDLIDNAFKDIRLYERFIQKINGPLKNVKVGAKVVIIDEASMVDELLLGLLFNILDIEKLEYLIIVGDENQLPPIGLGKPFIDIINYLIERNRQDNIEELNTPIRFPLNSGIWLFSSAFASGDIPPDPMKYSDETLKIMFFDADSEGDLKNKLYKVLKKIDSSYNRSESSLIKLLNAILNLDAQDAGDARLDRMQILSPIRWREFGSEVLNKLILNDVRITDYQKVKIINERNRYTNLKTLGRTLAIPNGAIGLYFKVGNNARFFFQEYDDVLNKINKRLDDLSEYIGRYEIDKMERSDAKELKRVRKEVIEEIIGKREMDVNVSPAYAITVHKSQGSDFEHVIFILPRKARFVSKELMYTAITRARSKLYLFLSEDMLSRLNEVFDTILSTSDIDKKSTLLFKYRFKSTRIFAYKRKNGEHLYLRSKIELIIAQILDKEKIDFVYEPREFIKEGIKPDFRISINNKTYYIEHLGMLDIESYRRRWNIKRKIYEKLGLLNNLITLSEPERGIEKIEEGIQKLIIDIKKGELKEAKEGYPSKHHYILQ